MKFTYSLDISEYDPHVVCLMDADQNYIKKQIVMVIYESFITSGDEDYLTARLLAQKGLYRAFYWAAAQSIEKYLKALLLLNGNSVANIKSHSIDKLFERAVILDAGLKSISLTPHSNLKINKECTELIKTFTLKELIENIDKHGCADNRYNSFGVEFDTSILFALDNFLFYLRGKLDVPDIFKSFKKIDVGLVNAFKDNNPLFCEDEFFHTEIPSEKFQARYSYSVTTLDFVNCNENDHRHKYVLTWLNEKMLLPRSIKGKLKANKK